MSERDKIAKGNKSNLGNVITGAILFDDGTILSDEEYEKEKKNKLKEAKDFGDTMTDRIAESQRILGGVKGLIDPPYKMETLMKLQLSNTFHNKCIQRKAIDVCGKGYHFELIDGMSEDKKQLEDLKRFTQDAPEEGRTFSQITNNFVVDRLSCGNGALEIGRDRSYLPALMAHIPFYTLKVHSDNKRWAHEVDNDIVWFNRFGVKDFINKKTGETTTRNYNTNAHELLLLQNYTSMSTYYGIPEIISSISAILANKYEREYNLQFFENNAVPRYAVIITGGVLDQQLKGQIRDFFSREIKKNNHSTLVLEIPNIDSIGGTAIKVDFKELDTAVKEGHFRLFRKDLRDEILLANGVPPEKLGISESGSLGGNLAEELLDNYNSGEIEPIQTDVEDLLYMVTKEFAPNYKIRYNDMDIQDKERQAKILAEYVQKQIISINEARNDIGYPDLGPAGDKIYIFATTGPIEVATTKQMKLF